MIPQPKFQIGDVVFHADCPHEIQEQLPCPDCLGTKIWKITMPSGEEHDASCQRCTNAWGSDIPNLVVQSWVPTVRRLTIGSIQIDTNVNPGWYQDPVRYMCLETGVGSGSVYNESKLHQTEAAAQLDAQFEANKKKVEYEAKQTVKYKRNISTLKFLDAREQDRHGSIFYAWIGYRNLIEELQEILKEGFEGDKLEAVEEKINDQLRYHSVSPFEKLLRLVDKVLASGTLSTDLAEKLEQARAPIGRIPKSPSPFPTEDL